MAPQRVPGWSRSTALASVAIVLILAGVAWWLLAEPGSRADADTLRGGVPAGVGETAKLPVDPLAAPAPLPAAPASSTDATPATGEAAAAWPPGVGAFTVTGRIVDERGVPWPGAVVRLVPDESSGHAIGLVVWSYSLDLDRLERVTTGSDGRFALRGPWLPTEGLGRVVGQQVEPVVLVQAEGMAFHAFPLANHDGRDRDVGDLVLGMQAATVVARAVDESGAPIAGAAAGIYSWGLDDKAKGRPGAPDSMAFNLMGLSRVRSDAAGRFELKGLWPSVCKVSFSDARHDSKSIGDVRLTSGATTDLGDVTLPRGGHVAGVVRDAQGAPIAGAEIWARAATDLYVASVGSLSADIWEHEDVLPAVLDNLHDSRTWPTSRAPVRSDAEGRFDRPGLSGDAMDVLVEAHGYEPRRLADVPVDTANLDLVLRSETNLPVRVVDATTEQPVAAASLKAFRCAEAGKASIHSPTSAREVTAGQGPGAFVVHAIGTQATRLIAAAPGCATESRLVPVAPASHDAPASTEDVVTLRLHAESVVDGRVQDPDGKPLAGADVKLWAGTEEVAPDITHDDANVADVHALRTSADGRFHFERLGAGTFSVRASCDGFHSVPATTLDLATGQHVELPPLVLRRAAGLAGTVRRADGTPAAGLLVSANASGDTGRNSEYRRVSVVDCSGGFAISGVPSGSVTVSVREKPGARPWLTQDVTLAESETRTVDLVLPRPAVIRGSVLSAGRPVAGARVQAVEQGAAAADWNSPKWTQDTGDDGRFVLQIRQEGNYVVSAAVPAGGASAAAPVQAVWGLDLALDFDVGAASISGDVVDADSHAPPAGVSLRLSRDGKPATDWIAASDAGAFRFAPLLAGRYVVESRGDAYPPTTGKDELVLEDGQELKGVVVTVGKGAVIDADVLDVHGQPDAAWVFLVTPGAPPVVAQHGAPGGHLHLQGLAAGHYRLVVANLGYDDDLRDPDRSRDIQSRELASADFDLQAGEHRHVTLQKVR